jgi:pimeloyl-ACP methyl ester carboxylesterase
MFRDPSFRLILLPGLGADYRLLEPQRVAFAHVVVPPWIPPLRRESLPHYAARLAETIVVQRDRPLVLGGVSFGGMLAYEMAHCLKPDAVALIASCRTERSLRPFCRIGGRLLPLLPSQVWGIAKLLAGPALATRRKIPAKRRELTVRMFREQESQFMHWTVRTIMAWKPSPPPEAPVFQIHGGRDRLIPARRVAPDVLIPDGGHLINVTHADQVNAFLRRAAGLAESA